MAPNDDYPMLEPESPLDPPVPVAPPLASEPPPAPPAPAPSKSQRSRFGVAWAVAALTLVVLTALWLHPTPADHISARRATGPVKADALASATTLPGPLDDLSSVEPYTVYFNNGEAAITPEAQDVLDRAAADAVQSRKAMIQIESGDDDPETGPLADHRAQALVDSLTAKGVDASRVKIRSYPDSAPMVMIN